MIRYSFLCSALALVFLTSIAADRAVPGAAAGASVADLANARVEVATEALQLMKQQDVAGAAGVRHPAEMNAWLRRWAEARLEVAENKDQRVAILTEWVAAMKEQESRDQKSFAAGVTAGPQQLDLYATKYMRLEAELRLAKTRAE
jgi:hypothetical protein